MARTCLSWCSNSSQPVSFCSRCHPLTLTICLVARGTIRNTAGKSCFLPLVFEFDLYHSRLRRKVRHYLIKVNLPWLTDPRETHGFSFAFLLHLEWPFLCRTLQQVYLSYLEKMSWLSWLTSIYSFVQPNLCVKTLTKYFGVTPSYQNLLVIPQPHLCPLNHLFSILYLAKCYL